MAGEIIYSVFVSSTYEDLREERAEVQKALLKLHCLPIGMELFPSANDETWEFIKRQIKKADYYVVIIAGRYGSTAADGVGYTEMEYDFAREIGKPVLAFVRGDRGKISRDQTEVDPQRYRKLEAFIEKVQRSPVNYFTNPHELATHLLASFVDLRERQPGIGYIRADEIAGMQKYVTLLEETRRLQPFHETVISAILGVEAAYKRRGAIAGISTGFTDLDHLLRGLNPSNFVVLAGRPLMGGVALAASIGVHAARSYRPTKELDGRIVAEDGAVVLFFSLELSAELLATQILAGVSGVSPERIRRAEISEEEFDRFIAASQDIHTIPLFIDDTRYLTMSGIRARARRLLQQQGLGLIIVDNVELIASEAGNNSATNQMPLSVLRGLKDLATEFNVPVLALSQPSLAIDAAGNQPAPLSIREFTAIEQYADVMLLLHREEPYLARAEPIQRPDESGSKYADRYDRWADRLKEVMGTARIEVATQRQGPIGTVILRFNSETNWFENLPGP